MVREGNRGKRAGRRQVRKSGSICPKLVDGSECRNIPAESAKTRRSQVIYPTHDVNSGGSETERPQCFWTQMIIPKYDILAVNKDGLNFMQNDCAPNDC